MLCHYPFRTWRRMDKGGVNLHGHCHGRLRPLKRQFDVGVDVWDFRPVALDGDPGAAKGRHSAIVKRRRSAQYRDNDAD